jgi:hypothetical protein
MNNLRRNTTKIMNMRKLVETRLIHIKFDYFHKQLLIWFPCLDGLIQTRENAARVGLWKLYEK